MEFLTLPDGSRVRVISKENSRMYMLPIGTVYVDHIFANCSGTKESKEGYIIEDKDPEYEKKFTEYEEKYRLYEDYIKQGIDANPPIPPSLPKFIQSNLLADGESTTVTIIEPNEPDKSTKISEGFLKNTYKFTNSNGECLKELISSVNATDKEYEHYIRTGEVLNISDITKAIPEQSWLIPSIIIGAIVFFSIIFFIVNKKKR